MCLVCICSVKIFFKIFSKMVLFVLILLQFEEISHVYKFKNNKSNNTTKKLFSQKL